MGALCIQKNEKAKDAAMYFLSCALVGDKLKYFRIEKICLSLEFAIQKLRHYMQAYTIQVASKANTIRYIMLGLVLSWPLA